MFEKAKILLHWARFGGLHLLTLRWQLHKEATPREMTVFAFGNNLSPTNLLTLCKNDVVHNLMSNALLLRTQQRHRRKNSKQPAAVCVRACYTEACASVCVCVCVCVCLHLAEDRCWQLSRKSKLSTLLSQGILCSDQGANLKKKKKKKKRVTGS